VSKDLKIDWPKVKGALHIEHC